MSPPNLAFGAETLQEGTINALVTVMNTSSAAVTIGAIAIGGANASDFSEQTDCPASLPAGEKCWVRVAFKPSAIGSRGATITIGGACASTVSGTGVALADGFYVSPSGSDTTGDGSLASPWATLTKAQAGMRASSGAKMTTYLRAGTYAPANIRGVRLRPEPGQRRRGETWSYYPPDGVDSAIIDGGSTKSGTGLSVVIGVGGASNLTIDGLTIRELRWMGNRRVQREQDRRQEQHHLQRLLDRSIRRTGRRVAGGCSGWSVLNNVMHDITGGGANIVAAQDGTVSDLLYSGNFVYNTCTSPDDGGDCGALYTQDNTAKSTNITITGNFVRDGNPWRGKNAGSAIYLDDCLSNATVSGNVMTGTNGANTTLHPRRKNDVYIGNIIDLGTYGQHISAWQTSANQACNVMTGNKYTGNIIITKSGGAYSDLSYPKTVTPTVQDNIYFSYAGNPIDTTPRPTRSRRIQSSRVAIPSTRGAPRTSRRSRSLRSFAAGARPAT